MRWERCDRYRIISIQASSLSYQYNQCFTNPNNSAPNRELFLLPTQIFQNGANLQIEGNNRDITSKFVNQTLGCWPNMNEHIVSTYQTTQSSEANGCFRNNKIPSRPPIQHPWKRQVLGCWFTCLQNVSLLLQLLTWFCATGKWQTTGHSKH